MNTTKNTGRVVGALLILQLVGMYFAFSTLMPILTSDYMMQAVAAEPSVRFAVILLFINSAITLAMSIGVWPHLREYSTRLAIWVLAFGIIWFVIQAVDNAHILSMLSLSKQHASDGGANREFFSVLGSQVRSTRVWMHFTELLVIDLWFGLFYWALFAFRFIPRLLGGLALLGVLLHLIGISFSAFVGYSIIWPLAYPLAISYLIIGGWLTVKGFPEREH